jgi:hypothetical protein
MEITEKTQTSIIIPHLDCDVDLENFLIDDEVDKILMQLLFWTLVLILLNFVAW